MRALTLTAHIGFDPSDSCVILEYCINNQCNQGVFALNKLWRLRNNERLRDPEHAYRFVHDNVLLVLFGVAPLPRMTTTYRLVPMATFIPPRTTFKEVVAFELPLREYSAYFTDPKEIAGTDSVYKEVIIQGVEVVVEYLMADESVKSEPWSFDSSVIRLINPIAALEKRDFLKTYQQISPMSILKRKDYFERCSRPSG